MVMEGEISKAFFILDVLVEKLTIHSWVPNVVRLMQCTTNLENSCH